MQSRPHESAAPQPPIGRPEPRKGCSDGITLVLSAIDGAVRPAAGISWPPPFRTHSHARVHLKQALLRGNLHWSLRSEVDIGLSVEHHLAPPLCCCQPQLEIETNDVSRKRILEPMTSQRYLVQRMK